MNRPLTRRSAVGCLLLTVGFWAMGRPASGQETLPTPPNPSPVPGGTAPIPGADVPPVAGTALAAPTAREAQLEERVRQLEEMVGRLAAPGAAGTGGGRGAVPPGRDAPPGSVANSPGPRDPNTDAPAARNPNASYPRSSGAIAPGQGTPANPPPSDLYNMPAKVPNYPLKGRFGPGFEFRTEDDEFVLQFHNLTQAEGRFYQQGGQQPTHDTFAIPRQWYMFSGRLGKPYEYFVSIQQAFDVILPLDIFANIHFDDRLQFKLGRYKTPFTYEFYALPIQGLIQPERSLFFNNFALNRQVGATVWGQIFEKKVDYAAAILNTARNGFVDNQDGKDFAGFLNWRPFLTDDGSFFQFLSVGGSVLTGNVLQGPIPQTLRTAIATTGNSAIGVPFLGFNNNVREAGRRDLWDLHAAIYYKQLSVVGEWQSGTTQYALSNNIRERTRVPVQSFYVQAGYFITGETVSGRNVVNPIRPFDLRPGSRGPGAIELTARYNFLQMGPQVFNAGLSDPNLWTRSVYLTDVGLNWYWTQNIKWLFDWQHAGFGTPVNFAPGRLQSTSDLFWARLQIYF